jgi:hypothetical protein
VNIRMFIEAERTLELPYNAARARLANLVHGRALIQASRTAYQQGGDGIIRVGPIGDMPGASKLVRVLFLDPVDRGTTTTVAFRWEAAGTAAGLFPVLDADVTLSPDSEQRTHLALVGSYRAPLGRLGAGLDKAVLHLVATATIRAFLEGFADTLTNPVTAPGNHSPSALVPGPVFGA